MVRHPLSAQEVSDAEATISGMPEKARRLYLARIALRLGHGGQTYVSKTFGVSRGLIFRGIQEVKNGDIYHLGDRCRRPGGGRLTIIERHRRKMISLGLAGDELEAAIDICIVVDEICDTFAYGDPMTSNKWINATTKAVANAVFDMTGQRYSNASIKRIIRKIGFSLQQNKKYNQVGSSHPERNDQFIYINELRNEFEKAGDPVISLDAKAAEKAGDFLTKGRELRRTNDPRRSLDHDFAHKWCEIYPAGSPLIPNELMEKQAIMRLYGVYCCNNNMAHTTLGISHDTAEFVGVAIKNWWFSQASLFFPNAKRLLILADGGGSNKAKGWLFKEVLQQLADDLNIDIYVCHYPPGTSKYNPIERRLWSYITINWSGKPLKNPEYVKEYVEHTTTDVKKPLKVTCEICSSIFMTEAEKKKCIQEKRELQSNILINDPALQNDVLIAYSTAGKDANSALRKWNYSIRPHAEYKKWKNYKLPTHSSDANLTS